MTTWTHDDNLFNILHLEYTYRDASIKDTFDKNRNTTTLYITSLNLWYIYVLALYFRSAWNRLKKWLHVAKDQSW